ncbi:hypothetical protein C6496_15575 [Candidatus Poribacteria bacterium]|nr:MAG: hypothetical protein C6496_15575 [Candidatus Poribacteria bacterium]
MLGQVFSSRAFLGAFFCVSLIIGGTQWYSWHVRRSSAMELAGNIRKLQQLENKEKHSERDISDVASLVWEQTENTPVIHESGTPRHETSAPAEIDSFQPLAEEDLLLSNTEEDPFPIVSAKEFHLEKLADWTEDLQSRMQAKYPEIMEFPTLTAEEIANRYPTEEDWKRFRQRSQEMVDEFLDETKELLSSLPNEISVQVMEELHRQFSANWGEEAADDATRYLQQFIE